MSESEKNGVEVVKPTPGVLVLSEDEGYVSNNLDDPKRSESRRAFTSEEAARKFTPKAKNMVLWVVKVPDYVPEDGGKTYYTWAVFKDGATQQIARLYGWSPMKVENTSVAVAQAILDTLSDEDFEAATGHPRVHKEEDSKEGEEGEEELQPLTNEEGEEHKESREQRRRRKQAVMGEE